MELYNNETHVIDTLQNMACQSYMKHCKVGAIIPYDIPGTHMSWVKAWVNTTGVQVNTDIIDFISECIFNGSSTRNRVSYDFRRRVEIICDTIGINRGPFKRDNLSDMVINLDDRFSWKKKKVTSYIMDTWNEI